MNRILRSVFRFLAITTILFSVLAVFFYVIGSFQHFIPSTQFFLLSFLYFSGTLGFWSGMNLVFLGLLRGVFRLPVNTFDFFLGGIGLLGGAGSMIFTQLIFAFLQVNL